MGVRVLAVYGVPLGLLGAGFLIESVGFVLFSGSTPALEQSLPRLLASSGERRYGHYSLTAGNLRVRDPAIKFLRENTQIIRERCLSVQEFINGPLRGFHQSSSIRIGE